MSKRTAEIERKTSETDIRLKLVMEGTGETKIDSGIGFLDHMLDAFGRHGRFDLELTCEGDLRIDDHHTVEDCAICLGKAFDEALGERKGIQRFGSAYAPLDEALARTVVDLSGRPSPHVSLKLQRESIGDLSTENIPHMFRTFGNRAGASLHVDVLKGKNDHHKVESAFKSFAIALSSAARETGSDEVRSTKGSLK